MAASGYFAKIDSKPNSCFAIVITAIIHLAVILFFVNAGSVEYIFQYPVSPMQLIQLKPEVSESLSVPKAPSVNFQPNSIQLNFPNINFDSVDHADLTLTHSLSDLAYELPNPNDIKYRDVFDPKLRQKLIDAQVLNKPPAKEKPTSWTEIDGRTFVDMGNGECLVSMRKVDSRERGTNWGMTRCGKTDSEKMMDNVTADLEARKHPLQTQ